MAGILILGAGGHARVVADILLSRNEPVIGYLDDDSRLWGQAPLGVQVLGPMRSLTRYNPDGVVVGVGSNRIRQFVTEELDLLNSNLLISAIHPTSVISSRVRIGRGSVVAAGAIINPGSVVGDLSVINTGASVDHDSIVESYVHVAPGARLAGGVRIGTGTLFGVGAIAIPNTSIGSWSIIGAGAVVTDDLPDNCTAVGVPARVIKQREPGWQLR